MATASAAADLSLVTQKYQTWDESYQELRSFWEENGHCRPKATLKVGRWAAEQRKKIRGVQTSDGAHLDNNNADDEDEQQRRIKLLDEIEFDWQFGSEKQEKNWQFMFRLLKKYRLETGHMLPMQKELYQGESLGNWVTTQQSSYRNEKIQEHRRCLLEDIGFEWIRDERLLWKDNRPLGKLDDDWDERFHHLCDYKEEHGDTLVNTNYTTKLISGESFALGAFANRQRHLFHNGLLRKERQDKLESIRFVFEIDIYDAEASQNQKLWDAMFRKLSSYKEEHGDCDIPIIDETSVERTRLGRWVRQQRALYAKGNLAEPRYQALTTLDFTWTPHEERWKEMVGHLRAYKAEHGDCLVVNSYKTPKENATLGSWVRTVRTTRQGTVGNTELSAERIAELDELGFEWGNILVKHWDTMYAALKRYKEKHGDCRVPQSYDKDPEVIESLPSSLGQWVSSQRQSLNEKLEATGDPVYVERKQRLEELGFEFSLAHVNQENWETMLNALKDYRVQYGDCRVPYSYDGDSALPRSLGKWVYDQRAKVPSKAATGHQLSVQREHRLDNIGFDSTAPSKAVLSHRLFVERETKLNSIGFDWEGNAAHDKWMVMFDRLKEYHAENGDCRVPGAYDIDCEGLPAKLGNWVGVQKRLIPSKSECGHPVYVERKKLLDCISFEYDHVHEARWDEMFDRLKQYRVAHGDCKVPKEYDDGKGKNPTIFNWARCQRQVKGRAEKGEEKYVERKRLLDTLEYNWEGVDEGRWMAMFRVLQFFKAQHGHCDVPFRCGVGVSAENEPRALGPWCHEQRQYIPTRLDNDKGAHVYVERKRLLDSIEFPWVVLSDKDKKWNVFFERLKAFKATHGHCRVPVDSSDDTGESSLYRWVNNQLRKLPSRADGGDPMFAARKQRLDAIGFEWHSITNDTWEKMRLALAEYKKKHGHMRVPYRGKGSTAGPTGSLGIWVYSQRAKLLQKAKAGDSVAIERKEKLDGMGFEWNDTHSEQWETMFAGLVRFHKRYGHCKVKRDYKDESSPLPANLGSWLSSQRTQIPTKIEEGDEVAIARKGRLDALGFVWQTRAPPKAYQRNGKTIEGKQRSSSEAGQASKKNRQRVYKQAQATSSVNTSGDSNSARATGSPGPDGSFVEFPEFDGSTEPKMWKKAVGQFARRNRKNVKASLSPQERQNKEIVKEILRDRWLKLNDNEKDVYRKWSSWDQNRFARDLAIFEQRQRARKRKKQKTDSQQETARKRTKEK